MNMFPGPDQKTLCPPMINSASLAKSMILVVGGQVFLVRKCFLLVRTRNTSPRWQLILKTGPAGLRIDFYLKSLVNWPWPWLRRASRPLRGQVFPLVQKCFLVWTKNTWARWQLILEAGSARRGRPGAKCSFWSESVFRSGPERTDSPVRTPVRTPVMVLTPVSIPVRTPVITPVRAPCHCAESR